jgi:hypothetical protein
MAKTPVTESDITSAQYRSNDSLSKAIRNQEEATIFMAELDAAFKIAQSR